MANHKLKYSDKQIKEALIEAQGGVYLAAAKIGCDASTIYNRINAKRWLKRLHQSFNGQTKDMARLGLQGLVMAGDRWAIGYALNMDEEYRRENRPIKVAPTDPTGEHEYTAVSDIEKLIAKDPDTEELAIELLRRLAEVRNGDSEE